MTSAKPDICVVGGAGHVGLPLGLSFAQAGLHVLLLDVNQDALDGIRAGKMPFLEHGGQDLLEKALSAGRLSFDSRYEALGCADSVIVTIGTPVDEFLSPKTKVFRQWADQAIPHLRDGQLLILRSTVYPGTSEWLEGYLRSKGRRMLVAFCPERIVQGQAIRELAELPQIVSGVTDEAREAASRLLLKACPSVVPLAPKEAEFAKLFTNAYRYIQFAAANQFWTIAHEAGLDYHRILTALRQDYPRARDIPRAGFAAGPCLLKDTMQLAAYAENGFSLGQSAMLVNEGLALYLVGDLKRRFPLEKMTVGLLGMAFKAECDDIRSSLSYKLKKTLQFHVKEVLTTDPFVTTDTDLLPVEELIERSDVLVLCTPHRVYKDLNLKGKEVVDVWGFYDRNR